MFAASKSGRAAGAAPTPTTDASFAYVPLLLETTGTNGQQNNTFLDSSTNAFTITRNGTPTQGSRTPYWPNGQWSNYFSSSYLSVADSASLRFGAANFTIEAWVFRTASGATHTIACKGASTPTGWVLQISSADKLVFIDTSTSITGTTSLAANTWYYVAVVRAGTGASQTTLYVNGASDGTGTSATTFSQTDAMRIGTDRSAANGFAGYVSNLRLSNTNLTISSTPTTPLTALGSTIFLSCGYNRFVDGSTLASAITIGSGTPTVQAFQPFSPTASYTTALYGGSGYFGGSPSYLSVPHNAALNLVSGDFTIETWFYCTGLTASEQQILNKDGVNLASYYQYNLGVSSTGTLTAYLGNGNGLSPTFTDYGASTPVPLNSWNHVALVRTGSTIKVFFNGAQVNSTAQVTAMSDGGKALLIGFLTSGVAGNYFNGYIANTRIVKGTAVYTGAFKPPTLAPLTTLGTTSAASYTDTTNVNTTFTSGTGVLLNMTNAGIYDAAAQNNITTVGDAQVSTTITAKWPPTSMKFDGTGDWLTAIDNPQLQLGTGDFTIDGWVYLSATGVAYGIISKGAASTGWSVNITSGNKLQFSYTASNLTGATSLSASTWYYFAVVRSGSATGNLKVYLNGTADATSGGAVTDNFNQTSILYVGADRVGGSALNGYLQDVRITKLARTITTPTAAFPTR
jgi:hypothetical protein